MLTLGIPFKGFQSIGRRSVQVVERFRGIHSLELATGDLEYRGWKALRAPTLEYCLRGSILEARINASLLRIEAVIGIYD
jgi:hypothetical protein